MTGDELARRWRAGAIVKLPGWRWLPGMLTEHGNRYVSEGRYPRRSVLPDLTDAATGGCMLALLGREVHRVWPAAADRVEFWTTEDGTGASDTAQSIAEACARVALALGRWPGGGS